MEKSMDKIVALAKARGFVYPGSEIYGGLANTWDYGPLGVELKNNVKKAWWQKFVKESPTNVGVDCAILMNPQAWVASGHVGGFADPLMDCKECNERFRADQMIEDYMEANGETVEDPVDAWSNEAMATYIEENNIGCPSCGKHNFTDIRQFNLMFKTFQGVTEDAKNVVYLRPETAKVSLLTLRMFKEHHVRRFHLVLVRLVNHLEMRSLLVTLLLEQENLSKWNLNSSVNRALTLNGLNIGRNIVWIG